VSEHVQRLIENLVPSTRVTLAGTPGGMDARVAAELASCGRDVLWIARDDVTAAAMVEALAFFAPTVEVLDFPAWDCLPYDRVSPQAAIVSARIDTLTRLLNKSEAGRVVVTTVSAYLQRVRRKTPLRTPPCWCARAMKLPPR